MTNTLSVKGLSKSFGTHKVIDNISFDVPEGSIFGFVGANGAGKTTTMKMILGLLPCDSGEIFVCDEKVQFGATKTNRSIGYLPDVPVFYGYMRPQEYLQLCGKIVNLDDAENKRRGLELLDMVGLAGSNKKISSFSRGMKQRLGMAQALLNEPRLLVCDEPTSALDPIGRKEILDILEQIKGRTTVVFSTHILSDVERICDRMAVLNRGHIALAGTLAELRARQRSELVYVEFLSASDKERFVAQAPGLMQGAHATESQVTLRVADTQAVQREVLQILLAHDILPTKIEVPKPSIESLYLEVTR